MKPFQSSKDAAPPLVEAVDARNRPLAVLPLPEVHRQFLHHRAVAVLVYDQEARLYLQKRSSRQTFYPGRWDVSTGGHVWCGEAAHDAALRELWEDLRIRPDKLRLVSEIPAGPGTNYEFLTVFSVQKPGGVQEPNPERVEGIFAYRREELACLVQEFRELLTPGLITLWERNIPFLAWEMT